MLDVDGFASGSDFETYIAAGIAVSPNKPLTEKEIVLTGLTGWVVQKLGIEPWGSCLSRRSVS